MSGICTDSPDFVSYTNGAVDQLLRRGKWYSTFRSIRACVYDGCVAWPRHVQTILAIKVNGQVENLYNRWFNYLPMDHCGRYYKAWQLGMGRGNWDTVSDGTTPVFNPIACGKNVFLRFYIDSPTDLGKTVTVMGIDSNGQVIRTQRPDATIQEGVVLTFTKPYIQTPMLFRHVTRVVKDETNYNVRGYQFCPTENVELDLCNYEPSEVSPQYTHTRISTRNLQRSGCCEAMVDALVKIKFTPVKYDQDAMLIDNEAAVANMIMAQRLKEGGDLANSRAYEADAFRELNFQMKDYFPDEQFVVDFQPFGRGNSLNNDNIRIGMM